MAVTWNPSDKNTNISLSNGNLTATATNTSWKSVRATDYKSSGKWYWEVTIDVGANHIIGIGTSSANINSYAGSDVYSYGYRGTTGQKFHSGSSVAYGATYTVNDVISIALDLDNGKIWWAKNGVWQAGGNPAAGANEAYSGVSGNFCLMGSPYNNTNAVTANFGATSLSYDIPSGFLAQDGYVGYFSGYVYEENVSNPVSRKVCCYRRDTYDLVDTTTSSGNGYYYLETTYSGSHFIVALDDDAGTQYNLAALDYMVPVTIS
jgi:hypothetical protein